MFLTAVSGGLIALGLMATATRVGSAFYAFGLALLPTLAFVGLITFQRVKSAAGGRRHAARVGRRDVSCSRMAGRQWLRVQCQRRRRADDGDARDSGTHRREPSGASATTRDHLYSFSWLVRLRRVAQQTVTAPKRFVCAVRHSLGLLGALSLNLPAARQTRFGTDCTFTGPPEATALGWRRSRPTSAFSRSETQAHPRAGASTRS